MKSKNPKIHAIILGGGSGERMKENKKTSHVGESVRTRGTNKLFLEVNSRPILYYSIMAFHDRGDIDTITVVISAGEKQKTKELCEKFRFPKIGKIIVGGKTRFESLKKGMKEVGKIADKEDVVIVHNGANPLASQKEIDSVIRKTDSHGACIAGHYIKSTIKEVNSEHIIKTHDRRKLFAAQTPQAAKHHLLKKAVENAGGKDMKENDAKITDEAMLLEGIGVNVAYTEADENNFKITTTEDYKKLKHVMGDVPQDFLVGIGQDSHMFEDEKTKECLILGGVKIKEERKLKANSDGDVVLHAVFNAISQALGKKSIGFYADKRCAKGEKDSKKYLESILAEMEKKKFKINSLGIMLECKVPKIDPLGNKMKESLSKLLKIPTRRIGITATSGENLTAFGQGLGIQCFSIVSLRKD